MKEITQNTDETVEAKNSETTNRRGFLGKIGKAAAFASAVGAIGVKPFVAGKSSETVAQSLGGGLTPSRASLAYNLRTSAALNGFQATPKNIRRGNNGDESLYSNRIGNFHKGLPHDSNGEVIPSAYDQLLNALNTGIPNEFEQIPMGGSLRLTNPQSGLAFDMEGSDSHAMIQAPAPAFASREIGAEIAENYWMALLRDVPFENYNTNPIAAAAAADLTLFGSDFKGPKNSGQVTPNLLFRGLTAGDKAGPLMSQYWYLPCFFGANEVNQQIRTTRSIADGGRDYMTDFSSWLAVQNGVATLTSDIFDPIPRYMRMGRDLGQWVHVDVLFQGYFQAFLCIAGLGVPVDSGNPYISSTNQMGFGTFGGPHIATLLCEVATRALKAVWYQKWFVHRRLRPEVFAARVHQTAHMGRTYPVNSEILNSVTTGSRLGGFLSPGNALLPIAFPEGSPTHPAYGAGHATVAGACSTILKAWFNESTVIQNPVVPNASGTALVPYTGSDTLTIGGELNKIASNVALGRNMAGMHWRSDATASLQLGEEIAISILKDQRACYNEQFNGFSLTKFDGTTITV